MRSKKKRSSENMKANVKLGDESPPKTTTLRSPSVGEPSGKKEHFPPVRDRQAYTGSNYIPATVNTPTTPRRPYVPAPLWEIHGPPTVATAPGRNCFASTQSNHIRELEKHWRNIGSQHAATPRLGNWGSPEALNSLVPWNTQTSSPIRMGTPTQQGVPSHGSLVLSPQARRQSVSSGSGTTTENTSSWTSPRRRDCESPEIAAPQDVLDGSAGVSKESEAPPDQPSEKRQQEESQQQSEEITVNAIYENGMRKTAGRGRMTTDYTGIVLPLMDEYLPTLQKPAQAPWMAKVRNDGFGSGMERLSNELTAFVDYMARTSSEINARNYFTQSVISAIDAYFSQTDHSVRLYGSDATSLGLPLSDIDLMIAAPSLEHRNPYYTRELKIQALRDIQKVCNRTGFHLISTIREEALVPILEIEDISTGLEMDISFEEPHSAQGLEDVKSWCAHYGHRELISLYLPLKHALNMRKLGFGSATTPYQGGIGSYVLLCMVIVFMETRYQELCGLWRQKPLSPGRTFMALLRFWGEEFNYETTAVMVNPPCLIPKQPWLPSFIFEVRSPFDGRTNVAGSAFGMKHIQETLKHFGNVLAERILEVDRIQGTQQYGVSHLQGLADTPGLSCGVLGSIVGGSYEYYEKRRNKVRRIGERIQSLGLVIEKPQRGTTTRSVGGRASPFGSGTMSKQIGTQSWPLIPDSSPLVSGPSPLASPHPRGPGGSQL